MRRALFLISAPWVLSLCAWGGPLYTVNFRATFDSGFGGLPTVDLVGTYTFEVLQPTYLGNDNRSAYYTSSIRSSAFTLNGSLFQGTGGFLQVDDNVQLLPGLLRDGYGAICSLSGTYATDFAMAGAGLTFEQDGAAPTAFSSLALPTSVADLSGFTPSDIRDAFLTFQNLKDGGSFATYATVQDLQFTLVPEPGPWALGCLGVGLVVGQWRKLRRGS